MEVDNSLSFRSERDANHVPDPILVKPEWIKGRAIFSIKLGYISLWLRGE